MSTLTVAELETLFTANIEPFEKAVTRVEARQKALDARKVEVTVTADTGRATKSIDKVESAARSIPDGNVEVTADTGGAESALDDIESKAEESGKEGGEKAGVGMAKGIIGALVAIPIAGAVIGVGAAIAKGFVDAISEGLNVEARVDFLEASTSLTEEQAIRHGRAAGEAYAAGFGESVDANFDLTATITRNGLLDPDATAHDAQEMISTLLGVSKLIGEDVSDVSRSASTMIKSGWSIP